MYRTISGTLYNKMDSFIFYWLHGHKQIFFTVGLGFLMLSLGVTLKSDDFRGCLRNQQKVNSCSLVIYGASSKTIHA
ncbi:sodium/pyruvate cotransporter BASS2, chloroplastic-like [Papaver somniferum]|uniref:sodium/pyruvate cotransporter BASS2, chloroplastic-like n=1 Tax=Papaver somniferum TaxID=3469 RepID=UPI000E700178|nr:sodium/pyruvate cotransporter BASS2, chloroplastic-like [Papaver somniferum]